MVRRCLLVAGCAVVLVVAAAASIATAGGAGRVGTACVPRWGVIARGASVPDLAAVAALSPSDVWAVGTVGRRLTPVAVHWDGRRLEVMRAFKPSSGVGELTAVAAVSSNDVWAVGGEGPVSSRPVVIHWNGRGWSVVRTPRLSADGSLSAVAAISANDVWVVGQVGDPESASSRPLIMHWNGNAWRRIVMHGLAGYGSDLRDIDATSSQNVWAVGVAGQGGSSYGYRELILHWNGRAWTRVFSALADENQSALALDVVSPREVWTLHSYWGGVDIEVVVHWSDGVARVATTLPHSGDPFLALEDIAATSKKSVWVAASRYPDPASSEPMFPRILYWNGWSWRVQHTALDRLPNTRLSDLAVLSARDIWAAGSNVLARYSC